MIPAPPRARGRGRSGLFLASGETRGGEAQAPQTRPGRCRRLPVGPRVSSIPPARAQPPITIVTSFGPASAAGIVVRRLTGEFTAMLGAPVVVKNTTGAAETIAANEVVRPRPDGNSLR